MNVTCRVKRQFKTANGAQKKPGDIISLYEGHAKRLWGYGFVSKPLETAAIEPPERAVKESPKKKQKGTAR